jgi:nucleotide-binding universal stress UspA family protein
MKKPASLLLPLDGSAEAEKARGCAAWLAGRLGGRLHVLEHAPGDAARAILAAVEAHHVDLLVMSARGESANAGRGKRTGSVAQAVIEAGPVPVVLLPARYREMLPWESMLVAASGEPAADQALEAAVQLAAALELKVRVAHCTDGAPPLGAYADAPHHEYAGQLAEMVNRSLATCSAEQCRRVQGIALCRGDPAVELPKQLDEHPASVLALGWHGDLGPGRAQVLKRLLEVVQCPLLLVREAPRPRARLKVGEALGNA